MCSDSAAVCAGPRVVMILTAGKPHSCSDGSGLPPEVGCAAFPGRKNWLEPPGGPHHQQTWHPHWEQVSEGSWLGDQTGQRVAWGAAPSPGGRRGGSTLRACRAGPGVSVLHPAEMRQLLSHLWGLQPTLPGRSCPASDF